jgi:tRNA(adenine34) deaminase
MSKDKDLEYMTMALEEAKISSERGDFPVGAVLSIDGVFVGRDGNTATTLQEWWSHAEAIVVHKYANRIKRARQDGQYVELYTTLDPCLMCMGAIVLNRVNRVVYACKDPNGGVAHMDPSCLTPWYEKKWPVLDKGPLRDESCDVLVDYMQKHEERWGRILEMFEDMRKEW